MVKLHVLDRTESILIVAIAIGRTRFRKIASEHSVAIKIDRFESDVLGTTVDTISRFVQCFWVICRLLKNEKLAKAVAVRAKYEIDFLINLFFCFYSQNGAN